MEHTTFDVVRAQDSSLAAISQSSRRNRFQPHVLPDTAGRRVEDAFRLGAPELFAARLRDICCGIEDPQSQSVRFAACG